MEVKELKLPQTNAFASTYMNQPDNVASFFHYNYEKQASFEARKVELAKRKFPREKLVDILTEYNKKFNFSKKTSDNIKKLMKEETTVVIGGQQAGLLTGPLYSIHKIISIIQLAKQQQERLNSDVVPVFWIAGEDHDFQEVNHTFTSSNGKISKKIISHKTNEKKPVSEVKLDKELTEEWINEIIATFGDRQFTKDVVSVLKENVKKSTTYTDFFGNLIATLLPNSGLILVDANDSSLRKMESSFFEKLINNNVELQKAIKSKQSDMQEKGYPLPLTSNTYDANLFYHYNGDRILLERTEQGYFWGKQNEIMLSKEELLAVAKTSPHLLSNNVVTRPLMQDYLFPTLAFIAGPGEIAYWGLLQDAFKLFDMNMPPVVPRHMITIVERHIEKRMALYDLSYDKVLQHGTSEEKENWLKKQTNPELSKRFSQAEEEIENIHLMLRRLTAEVTPSLDEFAEHNLQYIKRQLTRYEQKVTESLKEQHSTHLNRLTEIEVSLRPLGAPQERMWNVIYYMNRYGLDFL